MSAGGTNGLSSGFGTFLLDLVNYSTGGGFRGLSSGLGTEIMGRSTKFEAFG